MDYFENESATGKTYQPLVELVSKELIAITRNFLQANNFDLPDDFKIAIAQNQQFKQLEELGYFFYSANVAFILSKIIRRSPYQIAIEWQNFFDSSKTKWIEKIVVTKPGFLNISLKPQAFRLVIDSILFEKEKFAQKQILKPENINVEFVSVNPTGYLHFGHARGAVYGDTISRLLKFVGHNVITEYYINDAGNQINLLAQSVLLRYQELFGLQVHMSEDLYRSEDVIDAAKVLKEEIKDKYLKIQKPDLFLKKFSVNFFRKAIKKTLKRFNIEMQVWSSEVELRESQAIEKVLQKLEKFTYEKDHAIFLKTKDFGDDKDRVLIKSDKSYTYLLPDVAYHESKLKKSDHLINVWGADHSGYIKRMKIALEILGHGKDILDVETVQLVRVIKDNKEFKMSKRAGTSVLLNDILDISGTDVTRWFLSSRDLNTKLDFSLDMVVKKDDQNPCFYVQYNLARMHSLLQKTTKEPQAGEYQNLDEQIIILQLNNFYSLLKSIAKTRQVHLLTSYLLSLAKKFSHYYASTKIIGLEREEAKLAIVASAKIILTIGLKILGISTPNKV